MEGSRGEAVERKGGSEEMERAEGRTGAEEAGADGGVETGERESIANNRRRRCGRGREWGGGAERDVKGWRRRRMRA